jgi:hypothetical protein
MNLTEQQKQLLREMVAIYTGGCYEPFVFMEAPGEGSSLVYPSRPSIAVDATKRDVLRLRDEGMVDCEINSSGAPYGKPSANGIGLVQRNFSEEIPVFPDIRPDSIVMTRFLPILSEDLENEDSINMLMARMFHEPEVTFYYFQRNDLPLNSFLQTALGRGDILDAKYERLYYVHPNSNSKRDFIKIAGAEVGQFAWDWERAVAEKGPEYACRTLKLAERKRREMESLEKIHLEMAYRQKVWEEQHRSHVFLSYASQDHEEAEQLRKAIEAAGGTVFLDKKSLEPGDNFAERIRAALYSCRELWLLVSPSSLNSEWVMTEWGAAWVLQKTIVPILHRCRPQDLPARLSQLQCIDMYKYMELVAKRFPTSSTQSTP